MFDRIEVSSHDLINKPLWFHKRNGQETKSGYGKKLRLPYMIKYNNRLHRIYACQYSNIGTTYIVIHGKDCIVDIVD